MLEAILQSCRKAALAIGLSLGVYGCGDTNIVINNYVNINDGGQLDSSSPQDGGIANDGTTDGEEPQNPPYCSGELSNYPDMFVTNGTFNGYLVVGENAAAVDNLAMTDIAASMKYTNEQGELVPVTVVDAVKLDSEIASVSAQNLIVIGNSCVNTLAGELLGYPNDCTEGFVPGQGRIKLFKHTNGNYALLVAGYSGTDTRLAAKVIAKRYEELSGWEVIVEGVTAEEATLSPGSCYGICDTLLLGESKNYALESSDHTVGVIDMLYQDYAGGIHSTTFNVDNEIAILLEGETGALGNDVILELTQMLYQDWEGGIKAATFCLSEED